MRFERKHPTFLQYDLKHKESEIIGNINNLYHVETAPSDTYSVESLDPLDANFLHLALKDFFKTFSAVKSLNHSNLLMVTLFKQENFHQEQSLTSIATKDAMLPIITRWWERVLCTPINPSVLLSFLQGIYNKSPP